MSDLISRSAVIDIIHKEIQRTTSWIEHDTQINIKFAVEELPTAYDVEQVVKELEAEESVYRELAKEELEECCFDMYHYYDDKADGIERAIEIVKGYVNGLHNAIATVKEVGGMNENHI